MTCEQQEPKAKARGGNNRHRQHHQSCASTATRDPPGGRSGAGRGWASVASAGEDDPRGKAGWMPRRARAQAGLGPTPYEQHSERQTCKTFDVNRAPLGVGARDRRGEVEEGGRVGEEW